MTDEVPTRDVMNGVDEDHAAKGSKVVATKNKDATNQCEWTAGNAPTSKEEKQLASPNMFDRKKYTTSRQILKKRQSETLKRRANEVETRIRVQNVTTRGKSRPRLAFRDPFWSSIESCVGFCETSYIPW